MPERKTRTTRTTAETEEVYAGENGDTQGNPPMDGTGQPLTPEEVEERRSQRQEEGARVDAERRARGDE